MLLVAVLEPVDVDVDRLAIPLVAVLRLLFVSTKPVLKLLIPLVAVLKPVDVEVDKLVMLLVAVLKPVDVEVDKLEMPVDKLKVLVLSCATVTASEASAPSATLVMRRSSPPLLPPFAPTDTMPVGAV